MRLSGSQVEDCKVKNLPQVAKLRFTAPAEHLGDRSRKCLKDWWPPALGDESVDCSPGARALFFRGGRLSPQCLHMLAVVPHHYLTPTAPAKAGSYTQLWTPRYLGFLTEKLSLDPGQGYSSISVGDHLGVQEQWAAVRSSDLDWITDWNFRKTFQRTLRSLIAY